MNGIKGMKELSSHKNKNLRILNSTNICIMFKDKEN